MEATHFSKISPISSSLCVFSGSQTEMCVNLLYCHPSHCYSENCLLLSQVSLSPPTQPQLRIAAAATTLNAMALRMATRRLGSKLLPRFSSTSVLHSHATSFGNVAFRIPKTLNSVKSRATQYVLDDNLHEKTQIFVCDINPKMLSIGQKRALERAKIIKDNSMDGYTIAFGIRNVTHIEKVLAEAYRVLKRGGRFLCLELSHVDVPTFKELYDHYSFSIIPAVGEVVAGDRDSCQYLVESIRHFPSQEALEEAIEWQMQSGKIAESV